MDKQRIDSLQSYVQLGLVNLGLAIILYKEISVFYAVLSFAFIFIVISMLNQHACGAEEGQNYFVLLQNDVTAEAGKIRQNLTDCLRESEEHHETSKKNYLTMILLAVYVCLTFLCDWMEAFFLLNFAFIYCFMPQIFQKGRTMVHRMAQGRCPIDYQKKE